MEVVRLSVADCGLLAARYVEHGNSHRRMSLALQEAGAAPTVERLVNLRKLEHRFDVDLGLLCHWFVRREREDTHPVERTIINYLATARGTTDEREVWILIDRVRELRAFLDEGRLVAEPES